jgi:zinc protease
VANAEVRPEVTSDAIHAFFEQFDKIKNEAVSDDDLVNAKRYLIGSFPLQNESPAAIAGLALKIQLYDLPADYWDFYLKAIDETGKEDITEMARKYIREDRMGIVVVGDAAKLESQLSPLGKLKIFDMEGREIIDR